MCDNKNPFELVYIKEYKKFIDLFENNQKYQLALYKYVKSYEHKKFWSSITEGKKCLYYARLFGKDIEKYLNDHDKFAFSLIVKEDIFSNDLYLEFNKDINQMFLSCIIITTEIVEEELVNLHPFVDDKLKTIVFTCKNKDVYNKIKNFLLREIEIKYIDCIGYCDNRRR